LIVNKTPHYNQYALQLDHGLRDLSAVEREIIAVLPPGTTYDFHINSTVAAEVNRSLEPESISLIVFGLIAAIAALIIAGGVIARGLQREGEDIKVLARWAPLRRCRRTPVSSGLWPLSSSEPFSRSSSPSGPLTVSPIGPVRAVYPDGGFAFDWPVLGYGALALLVLLSAICVGVILRRSPTIARRARRLSAPLGSRAGRAASDVGLPVTAVVGIRFALERRIERDSAPVRSALVGAVLAVTIAAATLTFGSSLNTLVTHPLRCTDGTGTTHSFQRQRHSSAGGATAQS
jgi:hypothetical protein